jgi:hypothetical protein
LDEALRRSPLTKDKTYPSVTPHSAPDPVAPAVLPCQWVWPLNNHRLKAVGLLGD